MPVIEEHSNHSSSSLSSENDTVPLFSNFSPFLNSFSNFPEGMTLLKSQKFMLKAAVIVGSGGFIYGYDIGIISGTLIQLIHRFSLSYVEQGLVVSFLPLGSVFGCLFGGPLCDYIGRWKTIIIQNLIYIAGALIIAGANDVETIYVGRFIVGVGTALSGIADIPYLTEISPSQYRGRLASAYEFLAVVGIFVSFLVNLMVSEQEGSWRMLFGLPAIFAFFQGALMIFLPDSPRWLIQHGQYDVGRFALRQALDTEEEVTLKFNEIKEAHENLISSTGSGSGSSTSSDPSSSLPAAKGLSKADQAFRECLYQYRWMFLCIMILMFFQQFTGGVVVRNFATSIFRSAGFSDRVALAFTVVVGFVKVLTVGWSILNLDGLGRKYLLLVGIAVQATGHFILFLAFYFSTPGDINIGVYVFGSCLILGGFSLGLGPITWLLQSEIFPTLIRGRAMGFSVIMRNVCEFLINFSFLWLAEKIGDYGIFLMFFALCLLALLFIRFLFVETKEKEPNEILKEFEENWMHLRGGRVSNVKTSGYSVMCGLSDDSVSGKEATAGEEEEDITVRL